MLHKKRARAQYNATANVNVLEQLLPRGRFREHRFTWLTDLILPGVERHAILQVPASDLNNRSRRPPIPCLSRINCMLGGLT